MSAIFGLVGFNGWPVTRRALDAMGTVLAQHGGDRDGLWLEGRAGLGQRLKCITPEDRWERQPLATSDGGCVLVCDGRLDNRQELAETLAVSLRSPDSAFVLSAYEKWGTQCAAHLVGALAFAIWDGREQVLLLSRSSQGERPLYYHAGRDAFAFGTTPFALFALPHVPRALDEQFVADYLARERTEPGTTFFRDVWRLLPGHTLVLKTGRWTCQAHWTFEPRDLRLASDDDYVEAFDALFTRVVSDHLRSERPVGIMLSGGYDSSSVAVTAAPLLARRAQRLQSFTEVPRAGFAGPLPGGRYADERPFVEAIAERHANLDAHFIDSSGRFFLDDADRLFQAAAMPFRNASNRVWYEAALSEAQRQGVGAVLTGDMGNLTISWDGCGVLSQLIHQGAWREAVREARALSTGGVFGTARRLFVDAALPLLPQPFEIALKKIRYRRQPAGSSRPWRLLGAIHPSFAKVHRVHERARAMGEEFRLRRGSDTRRQRAAMIGRGVDLSDGLAAGYQCMFDLESRDPTGDQRIVEFCLALPERQFVRHGERRWLIRRTMRQRWPRKILDNPARGLQAADWFERMVQARDRMESELALIEGSDLSRRAIDLPRLRGLVGTLTDQNPAAVETLIHYRSALEFGLMTGCFIRWFESFARSVAPPPILTGGRS